MSKKGILENNLYGVDINAEAVESGRKLNKLADKIKVGNSLIDDRTVAEDAFVWEEEFPEVFTPRHSGPDPESQAGGFDVVIGNPPYVRQERLTVEMKEYCSRTYETYHNSADLYIPFVEKGMELLAEKGKFSFIFPNKWLKAKYGKLLRVWLKNKGLDEIIDFGDLQIFEGATTYPLILTATRNTPRKTFDFVKLETPEFGGLKGYVNSYASKIDISKLEDDGWQLVSREVGEVLDEVEKGSVALGIYTKGEIYRGILTGLTEAFVIDRQTYLRLTEQDSRSAKVLKPFVMGKDIQRYDTPTIDKYLLLFPKGLTREHSGFEDEQEAWHWVEANYPAVASWLKPFETKARKRYDKGEFWWELRACDYYDAFEKPKIMYLVFQVKPAFIMDLNSTYSNNAIFVYPKEDYFLLSILNSKLGWFLISNTCTEIQNGYQLIYDYFKNVPIPAHVNEERKIALEEKVKQMITLKQAQKTKANTFLKELKKKKVTLPIKEQEEWKSYFEEYKEALTTLQQQIDNTDKQIDAMVYELYGLNEEEIAVVEGRD